MKPSFAEMIRTLTPDILTRRSGITFKSKKDFSDIRNFRKSIVTDLEDPKTQFNYLIAFLKICEKKFKTNRMNEAERLNFLATAYNFGIDKTPEQIKNMIDKKFFNTRLFKTENYSYAAVSQFWYNQYTSGK
jgi:hypothetical protein